MPLNVSKTCRGLFVLRGALQDELIPLNRAHRTDDMAALITGEILHTIAIVGSPEQVVDGMKARLGGIIGRTGFSFAGLDDDEHAELLRRLRA